MKTINLVAIIVVIGSIAFGGGLGLVLHSDQPAGQFYKFEAYAVQTSSPQTCGTIPHDYSEWLGVEVIGNRTNMNFASVSIYDPGNRISVTLPLNGTSDVEVIPTNSTFMTIIVPLAQYFDAGDAVSIAVTYSIATFSSQSWTITDIPIIEGAVTC